ncbi:MAG: recombinase family protein [Pseudomonadota bacterium]
MRPFCYSFRMLIGYARVSTPTQNLDRQLDALKAAGCDQVYADKASGASMKGRPQLTRALKSLTAGDVLVLAEWDRATRSMHDGLAIITRVKEHGATIKALDRTWCDLTTPIGEGILAFLSSLAQDERERIVRRSEEGREAAKARGVKFGRKPKLTDAQQASVRGMIEEGVSDSAIADVTGVHRTTISRFRRNDLSTDH